MLESNTILLEKETAETNIPVSMDITYKQGNVENFDVSKGFISVIKQEKGNLLAAHATIADLANAMCVTYLALAKVDPLMAAMVGNDIASGEILKAERCEK